MDNYLNSFREMISLRGLTDHTLKSYCTYIRAYLDYLSRFLHKAPEDVSWDELRGYIRWLKKSRGLSDRTINCAISQLRFFTLYVLHRPWDETQLPMRKFDEYLPYVPSKQDTWTFISAMPSFQKQHLACSQSTGLHMGGQEVTFSQSSTVRTGPLTPSSFHAISTLMKTGSAGSTGLPAILSAMLSAPICMRTALTCLP